MLRRHEMSYLKNLANLKQYIVNFLDKPQWICLLLKLLKKAAKESATVIEKALACRIV